MITPDLYLETLFNTEHLCILVTILPLPTVAKYSIAYNNATSAREHCGLALYKLINYYYCNDSKLTEFEMINTKNCSTAFVVMYRLTT